MRKRRHPKTTLSHINITPFVDVVLVLLIIFMVTAPLLQKSLDIDLPKTKTKGNAVKKDPFILKIKKNKKVYIANQSLGIKELPKKIKAILKLKKKEAIYIQADKKVTYETVAKVISILKRSGVRKIGLVTK